MFPTLEFFKTNKKTKRPLTVLEKPVPTSDMKDSIFIGTTTGKRKVFINLPDYAELGLRIAVIGQTGSGKSHLTRVILEEFIEKNRRSIIFDPEGEWSSIKTLRPEKITVIGGEYGLSIGINPDADDYELNDEAIQRISEVVTPKLVQILETKGRVLVFDLSDFEDEEKQPIYGLISKIQFKLQQKYKKTVLIIVDEASLLAPQSEAGNAKTLKTGVKLSPKTESKKNARRGRKFGNRQLYCCQRPSSTSKDVLAACNIKLFGRMEDEDDFDAITHFLKPILDTMTHLPKKERESTLFLQMKAFKRGQFFMCQGSHVQLIQVKATTKTKHVGSTPEDDY